MLCGARCELPHDRFPKDLFVGVYSPGRRLVEFQVEKKNVVGALAQISTVIARFGINICSAFVTAYPEEHRSLFSFIADLTGVDATSEQVAEELRKLDVVLDVKFREAKIKGLMVNDSHFPVLAIGERCIILRVETVGDMFRRLNNVFGSGAAVILYEMGVNTGENKMQSIRSRYGLAGREALEITLTERVARGWGIPEVTDFDREESRATLRVHGLFECLPFKGREKEARSHFFRGYLEGAFRQIFDREVVVLEEKCIAKGDAQCEFTCQPRLKIER